MSWCLPSTKSEHHRSRFLNVCVLAIIQIRIIPKLPFARVSVRRQSDRSHASMFSDTLQFDSAACNSEHIKIQTSTVPYLETCGVS